jgi:hypothetical protein
MEEVMDFIVSSLNDKLNACMNNIKKIEEQLVTEKELKNELFIKLENFYTCQLKNIYFKQMNGENIGQIDHVFSKNGVFYVSLYFLNVTSNHKLSRRYCSIELFGEEMNDLVTLNEDEYKNEFFDYINKRIKIIKPDE